MNFWVYILANRRGGALYVGVTNDLVRRAFEHREGLVPGFTKRYGIKMLVYYARHDTAAAAIQRESTGRASGRSISFSRSIRTGATSTMTSLNRI
jgi:putative endonuclease